MPLARRAADLPGLSVRTTRGHELVDRSARLVEAGALERLAELLRQLDVREQQRRERGARVAHDAGGEDVHGRLDERRIPELALELELVRIVQRRKHRDRLVRRRRDAVHRVHGVRDDGRGHPLPLGQREVRQLEVAVLVVDLHARRVRVRHAGELVHGPVRHARHVALRRHDVRQEPLHLRVGVVAELVEQQIERGDHGVETVVVLLQPCRLLHQARVTRARGRASELRQPRLEDLLADLTQRAVLGEQSGQHVRSAACCTPRSAPGLEHGERRLVDELSGVLVLDHGQRVGHALRRDDVQTVDRAERLQRVGDVLEDLDRHRLALGGLRVDHVVDGRLAHVHLRGEEQRDRRRPARLGDLPLQQHQAAQLGGGARTEQRRRRVGHEARDARAERGRQRVRLRVVVVVPRRHAQHARGDGRRARVAEEVERLLRGDLAPLHHGAVVEHDGAVLAGEHRHVREDRTHRRARHGRHEAADRGVERRELSGDRAADRVDVVRADALDAHVAHDLVDVLRLLQPHGRGDHGRELGGHLLPLHEAVPHRPVHRARVVARLAQHGQQRRTRVLELHVAELAHLLDRVQLLARGLRSVAQRVAQLRALEHLGDALAVPARLDDRTVTSPRDVRRGALVTEPRVGVEHAHERLDRARGGQQLGVEVCERLAVDLHVRVVHVVRPVVQVQPQAQDAVVDAVDVELVGGPQRGVREHERVLQQDLLRTRGARLGEHVVQPRRVLDLPELAVDLALDHRRAQAARLHHSEHLGRHVRRQVRDELARRLGALERRLAQAGERAQRVVQLTEVRAGTVGGLGEVALGDAVRGLVELLVRGLHDVVDEHAVRAQRRHAVDVGQLRVGRVRLERGLELAADVRPHVHERVTQRAHRVVVDRGALQAEQLGDRHGAEHLDEGVAAAGVTAAGVVGAVRDRHRVQGGHPAGELGLVVDDPRVLRALHRHDLVQHRLHERDLVARARRPHGEVEVGHLSASQEHHRLGDRARTELAAEGLRDAPDPAQRLLLDRGALEHRALARHGHLVVEQREQADQLGELALVLLRLRLRRLAAGVVLQDRLHAEGVTARGSHQRREHLGRLLHPGRLVAAHRPADGRKQPATVGRARQRAQRGLRREVRQRVRDDTREAQVRGAVDLHGVLAHLPRVRRRELLQELRHRLRIAVLQPAEQVAQQPSRVIVRQASEPELGAQLGAQRLQHPMRGRVLARAGTVQRVVQVEHVRLGVRLEVQHRAVVGQLPRAVAHRGVRVARQELTQQVREAVAVEVAADRVQDLRRREHRRVRALGRQLRADLQPLELERPGAVEREARAPHGRRAPRAVAGRVVRLVRVPHPAQPGVDASEHLVRVGATVDPGARPAQHAEQLLVGLRDLRRLLLLLRGDQLSGSLALGDRLEQAPALGHVVDRRVERDHVVLGSPVPVREGHQA